MANLQERRDKNGKLISYSIRVHRGRDAKGNQLKPFTATFKVEPTWSEKSARKKAEAYAATFEEKCKAGTATDNRQSFEEYCEYVLKTKETSKSIKHSTLVRYRELTTKVYPAIGHIKLKDLRPQQLNAFYTQLASEGRRVVTATAKVKLSKVIDNRDLGESAALALQEAVASGKRISNMLLAKAAGISASTVSQIKSGNVVREAKARAVAQALGYPVKTLFSIEEEVKPYEDKTILEYHQLISSVLSMAEEEMIVPYNAASKAKPPRAKQKEVNFFSPDTIKRIKLAFDQEPLKWRVMGYLLVYTGGRRGEVLGLKWEHIDFKRNRIHIVNNSLYSADIGIYEETPKTKKSTRWISMPVFVMDLLKEYKAWQEQEAERLAGYWQESGYVLTKDNGQPMHPDSVSDRLKKIEEKYKLPHLNAHAFRHSYVSALIFAGVDTVSIAASVGHSKTSTTENIYGHVFAEAEERNAAVIESVYG